LEETLNADLLLHVIDVVSEDREFLIDEVDKVLTEIGAESLPQLRVFNKLDLLEQSPRMVLDDDGLPVAVYLSARQGQGLDLLAEALRLRLQVDQFEGEVVLAPSEGKLRAALFKLGAIESEMFQEDGSSLLSIKLPLRDWERLQSGK